MYGKLRGQTGKTGYKYNSFPPNTLWCSMSAATFFYPSSDHFAVLIIMLYIVKFKCRV